MNVLVMGIGNLLLQDEGVGVRAVEEFGRRFIPPWGVELLDGGTCGVELLQHLRERDVVILLDAVRSGKSSGAITRFEGEEVPAVFQEKISPHQLGISDLLAALRLTDSMPAKVILLGVEPYCLDTGLELTPPVAESVKRVACMVAAEIEGLGLMVRERPPGERISEYRTLIA